MSGIMLMMLGGASPVVINPIDISSIGDVDIGGTPVSSVTFGTDGSLSDIGTLSDAGPAWAYNITVGLGTSYWVRMTKNSGDSPTSGTLATWLQLSSARTWTWTGGALTANVKLEIASDSGGTNVVATADNITVVNEDGS